MSNIQSKTENVSNANNKESSIKEKQSFLFDDSILDDILPPSSVSDEVIDSYVGLSDTSSKSKKEHIDNANESSKENDSDYKNDEEVIKKIKNEDEELLEEFGILSSDAIKAESQTDIKDLKDTLEKANKVENKEQYDDLLEEVKSLIKEGKLLPYDNDKDIDEYSIDEIKNLIIDNIENAKENAVIEFVGDLPEPVQLAIKYAIDGGQDLSSVLRLVADAMEGKNILSGLSDRDILKTWLKMKGIEEEESESLINSYEKKGILKDKLEQAKEELEKSLYSDLENKVNSQEQNNKKKDEMYREYVSSVEASISKMNIDKKLKKELYDGLTALNYELPNGSKTNKLYYLLYKKQFEDKDIDTVVEALWLLSDPEKYKTHIRNVVKEEVIKEVIKPKLKKAETSYVSDEETLNKNTDLQYSGVQRQKTLRKKFNW